MQVNGKTGLMKINMEVDVVEGLSGHSDRNQLIEFINKLEPKPRRAFVVHGELSKSIDLASTIHKILNIETYVPRILDALRIR